MWRLTKDFFFIFRSVKRLKKLSQITEQEIFGYIAYGEEWDIGIDFLFHLLSVSLLKGVHYLIKDIFKA